MLGTVRTRHLRQMEKGNTFKYMLSIIVVAYNPVAEKMKDTLISAISQEGIDFEIIVADDGSQKEYKDEICQLFQDYQFKNYKLVMNPRNQGTVKNIMSALDVAEGEYVNTIGPGDCFYCRDTFQKWIEFLKNSEYDWAFSEAKYYTAEAGEKRYISEIAHPQIVKPYLSHREKKCRWNYLVLKDIALGASLICKMDIYKEHLRIIMEAGVKYAEDNVWRYLMFKGNVGTYYPEITILYEYGTGISTSSNEIWKTRLSSDWKSTDKLIEGTQGVNRYQRRMVRNMKRLNSFWGKLFCQGKVRYSLHWRLFKRMTPV